MIVVEMEFAYLNIFAIAWGMIVLLLIAYFFC